MLGLNETECMLIRRKYMSRDTWGFLCLDRIYDCLTFEKQWQAYKYKELHILHDDSLANFFRSQSFFLWMELLKMICFALSHIESYQCISSMRSLSSRFYIPLPYYVSALSHFSATSLSLRLFNLYKLRDLALWIRKTDRKSAVIAIGACPQRSGATI